MGEQCHVFCLTCFSIEVKPPHTPLSLSVCVRARAVLLTCTTENTDPCVAVGWAAIRIPAFRAPPSSTESEPEA